MFGSEGASNTNFFSKLSKVEDDVGDNRHCGWKQKFDLVLAAKEEEKTGVRENNRRQLGMGERTEKRVT